MGGSGKGGLPGMGVVVCQGGGVVCHGQNDRCLLKYYLTATAVADSNERHAFLINQFQSLTLSHLLFDKCMVVTLYHIKHFKIISQK